MKAILALNSGSSSIKFGVYEARPQDPSFSFAVCWTCMRTMAIRDKDAAGKPVQSGARRQPAQKPTSPYPC